MNNDEVQSLIEQLRQLQLQQSDLLARLEQARGKETKNKTKVGDKAQAVVDETEQEEDGKAKGTVYETKGFNLGDKVRIRNPNPFQADRGVITKIGNSRITIQTKSGSKLQRAPKNLILNND